MQYGRVRIFACFVFLTLALLACTQIPPEYQPFFDLPLNEQDDALRRYPLEKQIDIFLIAMTIIRPPDLGLVDPLSKNGKSIVPSLIQRLGQARTEQEVSALLYALLKIDQDVYKWRDDSQLIGQLKQVASTMTNETWKRRIQQLLERPSK